MWDSDESFHLGRHPLSRAEIAAVGLPAHFARYVQRLRVIAGESGLRLGLWADMLALLPEAIPLLPDGHRRLRLVLLPVQPAAADRTAQLPGVRPCRAAAGPGNRILGLSMNGAFRHESLPVFGERRLAQYPRLVAPLAGRWGPRIPGFVLGARPGWGSR